MVVKKSESFLDEGTSSVIREQDMIGKVLG
jgi:hypothetical protein